MKLKLPAFHENKVINWSAYVEPSSNDLGKYDLIIGRDLMHEIGLDILFSEEKMVWDNALVSMQHPSFLDEERWVDLLENELMQAHDPITTDAERIQQIIDSKYCKADLDQLVSKLTHLEPEQRQKLLKLLIKFEHCFDGTLGAWNTEPVDLQLKDPNAPPYHARPYPVPHSEEAKLKDECRRMCEAGVLRRINDSEWASPMFTMLKPDGSLRTLADLREINKRIRRTPYPLPKITEILQKLEGFLFATSLDLNMGYYHILLTPQSSRICTVILPWGKYEYVRLPMGLCNAPDIFQEKMNSLMDGLEFARAYLDDLLIISKNTFEEHLEHLEKVLTRLAEAGLKINTSKSKFCQTELDYLGYTINRQGIKPILKKVEAILQIAPPKTRKQLRRFIGMVNYYRDVWPQRAHLLAPLTSLTSDKVPFKWTEVHQHAFDEMKRIIAKETLLTYPDFSKPFHIQTDASDLQLGACISQEGKPLAFYSRKMNAAQTRYTTTEQELLSIVETLKEFCTILLGQQIVVHTDHKNLTYKNLSSNRVLRWRLYIEEYSPELSYLPGEKMLLLMPLAGLKNGQQSGRNQRKLLYDLLWR